MATASHNCGEQCIFSFSRNFTPTKTLQSTTGNTIVSMNLHLPRTLSLFMTLSSFCQFFQPFTTAHISKENGIYFYFCDVFSGMLKHVSAEWAVLVHMLLVFRCICMFRYSFSCLVISFGRRLEFWPFSLKHFCSGPTWFYVCLI